MNKKGKALLIFICIFSVGVAAGFALNHIITADTVPSQNERTEREYRGQHQVNEEERQRNIERAQNRLANHLQLEDEQRDTFFDQMGSYYRGVRSKVSEHREEEREFLRNYYYDFREQVSDILSQEQLLRLDSAVHPDSVKHKMGQHQERRRR